MNHLNMFVFIISDASQADTAAEQKAFGVAYAKAILKTLGIGYKTFTKTTIYKVQVGTYNNKKNAEAQVKKLKAAGFDACIVTN